MRGPVGNERVGRSGRQCDGHFGSGEVEVSCRRKRAYEREMLLKVEVRVLSARALGDCSRHSDRRESASLASTESGAISCRGLTK